MLPVDEYSPDFGWDASNFPTLVGKVLSTGDRRN
ncbi:hypothetical protein CLV31_101398 [Algoriphagus aquaeductus]|uniref:Uncharacterized protein n=1 Tax=Algoriphagus aquaeductus TaxID=475299 RepID=A0A326S0G9_9BACT|nr:hypothetical protein CLV31_101398 [Algoriphagus aquaeductus]